MTLKNKVYKRKATVLFVDDEEKIRKATSQILECLFEKVLIAEDGFEAYHIMQTNKIDLLITDLSMPADGVTLISRVRQNDKALPIVIHTAHTEFMDLYKNINFIFFMKKPICLKTLLEIISKVEPLMIEHRKYFDAYKELKIVQNEARKALDAIWQNKIKNIGEYNECN